MRNSISLRAKLCQFEGNLEVASRSHVAILGTFATTGAVAFGVKAPSRLRFVRVSHKALKVGPLFRFPPDRLPSPSGLAPPTFCRPLLLVEKEGILHFRLVAKTLTQRDLLFVLSLPCSDPSLISFCIPWLGYPLGPSLKHHTHQAPNFGYSPLPQTPL